MKSGRKHTNSGESHDPLSAVGGLERERELLGGEATDEGLLVLRVDEANQHVNVTRTIRDRMTAFVELANIHLLYDRISIKICCKG